MRVSSILDKLACAGDLENLSQVTSHQPHCFCCGDINDPDLFDALLPQRPARMIVHFAAESYASLDPDEFTQTNIVRS